MQESVIKEMLKNVKKEYKDVYGEIQKIIKETGYTVSAEYKKNVNKKSTFTNTPVNKKKPNRKVVGEKTSKTSGSNGSGNTAADKATQRAAAETSGRLLKKITVGAKSVKVGTGDSKTIKIGYSPANALNKSYTHTSSNKGVVKITYAKDSITIKGVKEGKTVIKLRGDGLKKTISITVTVFKARQLKASGTKVTGEKLSKADTKNAQSIANQKTAPASTKEQQVKNWYNALPKFTGDADKVTGTIAKYLAKKGKKAGVADIKAIAPVMGMNGDPAKWPSTAKTQFINKLKGYGFSTGGVIDKVIPATLDTLLGDAIMKNGDTGLISARPGETVLTEEFTKQLQPATIAMTGFNEAYKQLSSPNISSIPSQGVTMNNEYQFTITGVDTNNMDEVKNTVKKMLDANEKERIRDWKKLTGRNR